MSDTVITRVNWTEIFNSHQNAVVNFAENNLSFRKFQRSLKGDAKKESRKLELHSPNNRRILARRACRRRLLAIL